MFKKLINRLFGGREKSDLGKKEPPKLNRDLERNNTDFFEYQNPLGSSYKSGSVEDLIQNMLKGLPVLKPVIEAVSESEKIKQALSLPSENHTPLYASLITIAFQLSKVGRHEEAVVYQKVNLELVKTYPETSVELFFGNSQARNMADALQSLGLTYEKQGKFTQALSFFLEAEQYFEKDAKLRAEHNITSISQYDRLFINESPRAINSANISSVYRQLGMIDKAIEYDNKSWQYAEKNESPITKMRFFDGAGNTAYSRGDFENALNNYFKALEIAEETQKSTITSKEMVTVASKLGKIYHDLGLYRMATKYVERCLKLNEAMNNHYRIRENHIDLAQIYESLNENELAEEHLLHALSYSSVLIESETGNISRKWSFKDKEYHIVDPHDGWRIVHRLGRLAKVEAKLEKAVDYLELAVEVIESIRGFVIDESQLVSYQGKLMDVYDDLIGILIDLIINKNATQYQEDLFNFIEKAKSRALIKQMSDRSLSTTVKVPSDILEREKLLLLEVRELEKALIESSGHTKHLGEQIDQKEIELEKLWDEIERLDPERGQEYTSLRREKTLSLKDTQEMIAGIGRATAAIAYYMTSDQLIIFCIFSDRQDIELHVQSISRNQLNDLALVNPAEPPSIDLRLSYWELDFPPILIYPIQQVLTDYELVYFIPHGILHSFPFQFFFTGPDQKKRVMETTNVAYAPSFSVLRFCLLRKASPGKQSLVLGAPIRQDTPEIAATLPETKSVAEYLKTTPLIHEKATKANLLQHIEQAAVIHIASHGRFDPEKPYRSALMLTGGDLTGEEILQLDLRAKLVVLSACETGVTDNRAGDEMFGLIRALFYAGASSVIVSLWNAYDEHTKDLMIDLYDNIFKQKKSIIEALANAQKKAKQNQVAASCWAPFILIGNWTYD